MNLALFLLALFALSIAAGPVANRLRLPLSSILVLLGFAASELVVGLGGDTGVRWHSFHNLVVYLLLPALIFEAALHLNIRDLARELITILSLAIPFLLVSTAVCAFALYFLIGHETGFPWAAALFTAAILSATDPVAVLAMFKKLGVPDRLSLLVDGESLFNDATAIVVAMIVLEMVTTGSQFSAGDAVIEFFRVFLGGIGTGILVGLLAFWLFGIAADRIERTVVTFIAAYGSYFVAEGLFHVSGIMATLAAALLIAWRLQREYGGETRGLLDAWAGNAMLANSAMFLLMGVTITTDMITERWLAMLIGIGAAALARAVVIYIGLPIIGRIPGVPGVPSAYRHVLYWGGLRGAVTIALAISLPLEIDWWFTAQSIAYGVVLFSLFVQAPTMPFLIRRLEASADLTD